MALLALAACGEKESIDPGNQDGDIPSAVGSAFTMTVSYTFNGLTAKDAAYGDFLVLYAESSQQSASAFESWKTGNDKPECRVQKKGTVSTNGSFESTIENLKPDTEYDFCVCFRSEDGGRRETSSLSTFRTGKFNPSFSGMESSEVGFQKANVRGMFSGIQKKDMAYCSFGFATVATTGPTAGNDVETPVTVNDSLMSAAVTDLLPNTVYSCRPYVKVGDEYVYGSGISFVTRNFDDMKVDLGLPSGIQWASCNLDAESMYESGSYYTWGYVRPDYSLNSSAPWWYDKDHRYNRVGDLAGTDYDAAHVRLGGHWRMPTKADMEELLNNCRTVNYNVDNMFVAEFKADNGNFIRVPFTGRTGDTGVKSYYYENGAAWYNSRGDKWEVPELHLYIPTSTQYEDEYDPSQFYYRHWEYLVWYSNYIYGVLDDFSILTGKGGEWFTCIGLFPSGGIAYSVPIRPVWDPNFQ